MAGRVTQAGLHVVADRDARKARVTQTGLQVVADSDARKARVTQVGLHVILKIQPGGSFTLDAQISGSRTGSFTADAILAQTWTGSFTVDAVLIGSVAGSFTANAVFRGSSAGSLTLDALLLASSTGSFDVDALILAVVAGGFPADAVLFANSGVLGFTADAWIPGGSIESSFTLDAIFEVNWGDWSETYGNPLAFTFTLDAYVALVVSGSFAADATIASGQAGAVTLDSTILSQVTSSAAVDAWIEGQLTGSFAIDAVLLSPATGTTSVDAYITPTNPTFLVSAVIVASQGSSFTVDAATTAMGFTTDAWLESTAASNFFILAYLIQPSFTVDAYIFDGTWGSSFATDAAIFGPVSGSFTLDASWDTLHQSGSFTVSFMWIAPGETAVLGVPTRIVIGGNDVTGYVEWATASFTAKVNGAPGDCTLDLLDREHTLGFTFGDEIHIHIDGVLKWAGWAQVISRTFPFPSMPDAPNQEVIWHIEGVDYNVVMGKRIIHDDSTPGRTWNYAAGTSDKAILEDTWGYLDMDGFTHDFHHVGDGILDIPGVTSKGGTVAQGGDSLADILQKVSLNTAGVYYVTPGKVVTYLDSETVTSPYRLTDTPSLPADVGYREVRIGDDGTSMVNDALVWGAGKGSSRIVFSEHEDSTSQTDHGLWQAGEFTAGIYKQASADALSSSMVEGSPEAHRGAKNPRRFVKLVTFLPVFDAGDVVQIENGEFSYSDALPVRIMTVTWPTPYYPRTELTLSWEIDAAWSIFDPWLTYNQAPPGDGGGNPIVPGPPVVEITPGCTDEQCGITDTFTRSIGADSGLGTSDYGLAWVSDSNGSTVDEGLSVDGSAAVFADIYSGGFNRYTSAYLPITWGTTATVEFSLRVKWDLIDSTLPVIIFGYQWSCVPSTDTGNRGWWLGAGPRHDFAFSEDTWYRIHAKRESNTLYLNVWVDGDTEPSSWMWSYSDTSTNFDIFYIDHGDSTDRYPTVGHMYVDDLDIAGYNRCSAANIDNFNRTVSNSWGTTSSGRVWQYYMSTYSDMTHISVDGDRALAYNTTTASPPLPYLDLSDVFTQYPVTIEWDTGGQNIHSYEFIDSPLTGAGIPYPYMWLDFDSYGIYMVTCYAYDADHNQLWFITPYQFDDCLPGFDGTGNDYGEGIHAKLELDAHSFKIKLWKIGTAEPSSWGSEVDLGTTTMPSFVYWSQDLSSGNYNNDMWLDNLTTTYDGMPCYPCSESIGFDNFNRTVASGWGSATPSGYAWDTYGRLGATPTAATFSVDGSEGTLIPPVSDGHAAYAFADITGETPICTLTAMKTFVMTTRLRYNSDHPADEGGSGYAASSSHQYNAPGMQAHIAVGHSMYAEVQKWYVSLQVSGDNYNDSYQAWITGFGESFPWYDQWIYFQWEYQDETGGNLTRARYWVDGDAIPDWQVSASDVTGDNAYVEGNAGFELYVTGNTFWNPHYEIDSIDFSGGPCYECSGITDTFTRSGSDAGTSDAGIAWTYNYPGEDKPYTDGSSLVFNPSSTLYAFARLGSGWPLGTLEAQYSIELSDWVDTNDYVYSRVGVDTQAYITFHPYLGIIEIGSLGHQATGVSFSGKKWVRVYIEGTILKARWWDDGDSDPGTWALTLDPIYSGPETTGQLYFDLIKGSGSSFNMLVDDLSVWVNGTLLQGCSEVDNQAGATGSSLTGSVGELVCEQISTTATPYGDYYPSGSTWAVTLAAYIPGSTMLYIDGEYQSGIWTETDPAGGTIKINLPVDINAIVILCYLSNGDLQ